MSNVPKFFQIILFSVTMKFFTFQIHFIFVCVCDMCAFVAVLTCVVVVSPLSFVVVLLLGNVLLTDRPVSCTDTVTLEKS